jgi:predicted NAD/FAD-binding protein
MSFSVSADGGRYEWCGRDERDRPLGFLQVLNGLFAQRRNLLSPSHLRMLRDVLRFQETARHDRQAGTIGEGSLAHYLARQGFSDRLRDDYLVPMGAAIWSTSPAKMLQFPAQSFINFFDNHCLLQWNRPQWRTVVGGSRSYMQRAVALLGEGLRLGAGVTNITRAAHGVEVTDLHGGTERFDHVVIAAHAPDALAMLGDATTQERAILGACHYAPNDVFLHSDPSLMPRRKAAWAAWNFLREGDDADRKVAVSYWMNVLQDIPRSMPVFVTLNPPRAPDPGLTFARFTYDHPQFDAGALRAVEHLPLIQGAKRTWFAGAWTGYGFHEDGLRSGLSVARALGALAPWDAAPLPVLAAAE